MEWTQQPYLPTVSGLDIVLWVAAYGVWRYLSGLSRVKRTAVATTPVRATESTVRMPVHQQFVPGRFDRRMVLLDKMGVVLIPRERERPETRRVRLRRAA
jgi:hypothetical protein